MWIICVSLLLILPPPGLLEIVDRNNTELNPTINSKITETDKKTEIASRPISTTENQQRLKEFAREIAIKYGLDSDKFDYTIQNESGYNPDPTGNILCRGISQYTLDTWLGNCSKTDERLDPYKAIECMGKMWNKGQEYRWDVYCFKYYDEKCVKLRGLYPG